MMTNYYIHKLSILKDVFSEFKLDKDREDNPEKFYVLDSLSKVNIFVGPNNSRKSRFIRLLASLTNYEFETEDPAYKSFVEIPVKFIKEVKDALADYKLTNYADINQKFAGLQETKPFINDAFVDSTKGYKLELSPFFDYLNTIGGTPNTEGTGISVEEHKELQTKLKEISNKYNDEIDKSLPDKLNYSFKNLYIPTLRGFRQFSNVGADDPYEEKTQKDYFSTLNDKIQSTPTIFTGYGLYKSLNSLYRGDPKTREKKKKFERFLSDKFYEGKEVEITPRENPENVHIIVNNEGEREVQDIGDGIQQLILLFFTMFDNLDKKAIFFIEEPEIFMHPGMQRQFLESIYTEELFKDFQFFFTTHSNHFLDMTLDYSNVSIFRCEKDNNGDDTKENSTHVFNVDSPDESLLASLGVRNSSVFLTNSTVWVEGVTDRMYYRHFLKLYQEHLDLKDKGFKEDLHYSFVEYGGNNITHWSFFDDENPSVKRLCAKLLLIVDWDDAKKKQERKKKIRSYLTTERFIDLKEVGCREVENLLSKDTLLKVIKDYEKDDSHINRTFTADYKSKPLGKFIEDTILKGQRKREASYRNEWGAINYKPSFALKAINHMKDFKDLSSPAKKITVKIYDFIKMSTQ